MMADGAPDTRTALMDAAEPLILARGFGGATVDAIVDRTGLSKGAFFHHFSTKADLARALLDREAERDLRRMESVLRRAGDVSDDPLVQLLIGLTLLEEDLRAGTGGGEGAEQDGRATGPGSLRAALAYEGPAVQEGLREAMRSLDERRGLVTAKLEAAVEAHAPDAEVDPPGLAELLESILEGARTLERTAPPERRAGLAARQLARYRAYLELLFSVAAPRRGHGG